MTMYRNTFVKREFLPLMSQPDEYEEGVAAVEAGESPAGDEASE